jgi:hypothetical protein
MSKHFGKEFSSDAPLLPDDFPKAETYNLLKTWFDAQSRSDQPRSKIARADAKAIMRLVGFCVWNGKNLELTPEMKQAFRKEGIDEEWARGLLENWKKGSLRNERSV